jgi:two-component system, OmpR family, phosphate regulon sensor histidine kinase PhoR
MTRLWRRRKDDVGGRSITSGAAPVIGEASRHAAFLEHAQEGMILVEGSTVRWLNPAAALMFPGLAEPLGRPLLEVARDHRIEALAERARGSRLEQAAEVELPGSGRTIQVRAVPVSDERIAILLMDTSRLRYLETVRQQFVANLSHEIRTPLAGLDLAAQTLSGQLPAEGDVRVFIDRVIQESERLQAILLNLRQLAELDAERIEVERVRFSLAELVTELTNRYQPRAAAANLRLRAEGVADDIEVIGDRGKTDQALQNIVDNALKFTRTGEVVVSVLTNDARVDIAVRDTGPGIPPRDLPRIFERFYKVDRSRGGQPGSGLGLSIARHLIELQGGTIVAESSPGAGTVVRVRLPRVPLTSR